MGRVFAGAAATSFGACANLLARAAAEWPDRRTPELVPAAARLVEAFPGDPAEAARRLSWQGVPKVGAGVVVDLLTGLCAINGALAQRAADHLPAWPNACGLDAVLVPTTRALLEAVGPSCAAAIRALRTACLVHPRARIAEPFAPPTDWSRPVTFTCRRPRCGELARFLADPERKAWVFKTAETDRHHLEDTVKRAGCDVDTAMDRRGRRYSLVCAKNQASYERRASGTTCVAGLTSFSRPCRVLPTAASSGRGPFPTVVTPAATSGQASAAMRTRVSSSWRP